MSTPPVVPSVFVSHSHLDNAFGMRLITDLRARLGKENVWYDIAGGLHGGDKSRHEIVRQITVRAVFLVILSPNALASTYVQWEMDMAYHLYLTSKKRLLPIRYQPCNLPVDWDILQWLPCRDPHIDAKGYAMDVAAILANLLPIPEHGQQPATPSAEPVSTSGRVSIPSAPAVPPPQPPPPSPIPVAGEALNPSADTALRAGEWSASDFDSHELEAWDHRDDAPFELPESPDDTFERTIQEARKARERNRNGAAYQRDTRSARGRREPKQPTWSDSGAYKAYDPYDSRERRSAGRRSSGWDDIEDDIEWDDGWQTGEWDTGWAAGMRPAHSARDEWNDDYGGYDPRHEQAGYGARGATSTNRRRGGRDRRAADDEDDLSQSLNTLAQLSEVGAPLSRLARVRMLFRRRPTAAAMLAIVMLGAIIIVGGGLFGIIGVKTGIIAQPVAIFILIVVVIAGLAAVISLMVLIRTGYGPFLRKLA